LQKEAGNLIEPAVSEPKAKQAISAETAAAEPEEDPPGTYSQFKGFLVLPKAECSPEEPQANSSKLVFPKIMA